MGFGLGGPGAAGRRVLAHQPDSATARAAFRGVEVRCRSHHRPPRTGARAPAAQAVPQGHRADCGRHTGTHPRPHRCRAVEDYRYSTNHQVVIDADARLVVTVGQPLPGNRNDCKAWELSGAKDAVGKTTVIADGGYRGTGLVIPHRRERGQSELPEWKEDHNAFHRKVRARVEHTFARMKTWKILRDCRLKGRACTTPCSASPAFTTSPSPDRSAGRTAVSRTEAVRRSFTEQPLGPGL